MGKEYKEGDTIALTEKDKQAVRSNFEDLNNADRAFRKATIWARKGEEELFKIINRLYPETKDYQISINQETMIVMILRKMKETKGD